MNELVITNLVESDWQRYKTFRLKALQDDRTAFGASYEMMLRKPDTYWQRQIENSLQNKYLKIIIAQIDEQIVGMIIIKFSKYKKLRHIARISSFYVDPDYRGQKIGKLLFQAALDEISKFKEIEKVKLTVNITQKTAINLYRNNGFMEVGKLSKEFKIDGQYFDVLLMEKLL